MSNKKALLYEESNGLCYWCGRQTYLSLYKGNKSGACVDSSATADHLYTKSELKLIPNCDYHELRSKKVLSCYRCNITRGRETEIIFNAIFYSWYNFSHIELDLTYKQIKKSFRDTSPKGRGKRKKKRRRRQNI